MIVINNLIDSIITNQLKEYLSMGSLAGKKYSDVIVKDGNVEIDHLYGKPEKLCDMLRERGIPVKVIMLHVRNAKVRIPWFNLLGGLYDITVEEVVLVLQPVDPDDLSVEQVRWVKESAILKAMDELVANQKRSSSRAPEKPSLFKRIKMMAIEAFRPKVTVKNVHLRYEHLVRSHEDQHPFAFGLLIEEFSASLDTSQTNEEESNKSPDKKRTSRVKVMAKRISVYCMPVSREGELPRPREHELVFSPEVQGKQQRFADSHKLFFEQQEELVARMTKVRDSSSQWGNAEWVFEPHDFQVRVWKSQSSEVGSRNAPLVSVIGVLPAFVINVTSEQLAAVFSLQALTQRYNLRAYYLAIHAALSHEIMPQQTILNVSKRHRLRPIRGAAAKVFWRSAIGAVRRAIRQRESNAGRAVQVLRLKREYLDLLGRLMRNAPADRLEEIAEMHSVQASLPAEAQGRLQHIEDVATAHMLAWWRLLGMMQETERRSTQELSAKRKGSSWVPRVFSTRGDTSERSAMDKITDKKWKRQNFGLNESDSDRLIPNGTKEIRSTHMDALPGGFIYKVESFEFEQIALRLTIPAPGTAAGRTSHFALPEHEFLTLSTRGVAVRRRSMLREGTMTHVCVRQMDAHFIQHNGAASFAGQQQLLCIEGSSVGSIPESLMGGPLMDPNSAHWSSFEILSADKRMRAGAIGPGGLARMARSERSLKPEKGRVGGGVISRVLNRGRRPPAAGASTEQPASGGRKAIETRRLSSFQFKRESAADASEVALALRMFKVCSLTHPDHLIRTHSQYPTANSSPCFLVHQNLRSRIPSRITTATTRSTSLCNNLVQLTSLISGSHMTTGRSQRGM
uniref:Uncharacterized protein n=1 Tax=Haptolina ericina TaxID=156174 RepID=A0A6T9AWI4_9EUKA|mmetsp:Transcript_167/g.350  ORF Transcript_167/g.350 Transcript_167/m.350 type:complete len:852 (+) Transcript_167:71-2626(+)